MARRHAFGGDNGTRELDALDSVDLEAIQLVRAWGVQNGHKERQWTYSPCPRPDTAEAPSQAALVTPVSSARGRAGRMRP